MTFTKPTWRTTVRPSRSHQEDDAVFMLRVLLTVFFSGFGGSGSQVDSARMNLASSFVNGFVNAAFGQDKLLTEDGNKWLYKNKDHGENISRQLNNINLMLL